MARQGAQQAGTGLPAVGSGHHHVAAPKDQTVPTGGVALRLGTPRRHLMAETVSGEAANF